jgi:membrane fusion protein, multidrug efflux system
MKYAPVRIVSAVLYLTSIFGLDSCSSAPPAAPKAPVRVSLAPVKTQTVSIYGDWVGNLQGYVNAQIQPHVSGYIVRQLYKEGSVVQQGQVLFQIDPEPFQAALDQAQAKLAEALAQLELAQINVRRDTPLVREEGIAKSQLDTEVQTEHAAEAAVAEAKANVHQAQISLNWTQVRSLVTGIADVASVQMGNLVSPTSVLTSVSQVEPIKVYFSIAEQEYLSLRKRAGSDDMLRSGSSVPLNLVLSDGSVYPYKGKVLFVGRQVDPQTGTIQVVATFPNPGRILRPGQFAHVHAPISVLNQALLVPQAAVQQIQGSYQVGVVKPGNIIAIRQVQVGPRNGPDWVITSGLDANDKVVTDGADLVHDGMKVDVRSPQEAK